jgi:membrane protein
MINHVDIKKQTDKIKTNKLILRILKYPPIEYITKLVKKFISDGCFILSSSITYYFLFSIFPIILILISISGIFIDTPSVKTAIFNFVDQNFPIAYEFTKSNIEKIIENRKGIGAVGSIFLIVSSTYVFDSIQFSLDKIFKCKSQRTYWKRKLYGILIIILIFIFILVSFASSTPLFYLANSIINFLNIDNIISTLLLKSLSILTSLISNFLIFIILYFFGTNRKVSFKQIYRGALVASVGWEIAKHVFIIYINNFANFELTYGTIGSIIAFLLWIFISSIILLVGAEINSISID